MEVEVASLKELFKHPGWQVYLDQIENQISMLFMEMWALEASKPESFVKFVELKSGIDKLRNVTYMYERELAAEKSQEVDASYGKRFLRVLKKITGGKAHDE